MAKKRSDDDVLGERRLTTFDFCIIGSGAGGGAAAHVLTAAGKNVLVLEAGPNPFPGLDRPGPLRPGRHSNDELKYGVRGFITPFAALEPRTFRTSEAETATIHDDVNVLPKCVGGAWSHADMKVPRFTGVDFEMVSAMQRAKDRFPSLEVPGFFGDAASANWADWPFRYGDLEPFYDEAERLMGVAGDDSNPFAPPRSNPYPMPPHPDMYLALLLREGASKTTFLGGPLFPHKYPSCINSRFYPSEPALQRPPCNQCGPCSGYGCPTHAKGSSAVTTLRRALLTGRCQLRYNCQVTRLLNDGGHVSAVEYIDGTGAKRTAVADAYVLAAAAIESPRICLLSETPSGEALGNSSGQLGQNLMFHFQTNVNGFFPRRVHGQRGQAVTSGLADFRGVEPGGAEIRVVETPLGARAYMGGVCEFVGSQGNLITEDGAVYTEELPVAGLGPNLKTALRELPLGQHLFGLLMQGEDAPVRSNNVTLDPTVRDVFGLPVPRITYKSHTFELEARRFYVPVMREVVANAGTDRVFLTPCDSLLGGPPTSRHQKGTLRMGTDPSTSVTRPDGRFHDVDNLYCCDSSTFPTGGGWNPTLTLIAVSLKIAHGIVGTPPG
ncbi:MAG TPA: GMC family oxidoreductase [Candidatus Limnocylindria bacterium]|nr:GMC family oxidoreductase [Candidatus Limnocylindria bacterium]